MKDDLLILKLLKVPVTIIKYLSDGVAMLTYFPNYLVILLLDFIIFNHQLSSCLLYYTLSWPLRLAALCGVIFVFSAQFYYLYVLLSISHLHWGYQLALTFVAFQGILALMRRGYLKMINKFSPTKLKSPLQHLTQLFYFLVDLAGIILTVINSILIINIHKTLKYQYSPEKIKYIRHISMLIHKSILDIIKLFYIKIFFAVFPWRFKKSIQQVEKEKQNVLQLTVLLTLLFFLTMLDLLFFIIFGIYCIAHPRRNVFLHNLKNSHQKFVIIISFVKDSSIEIMQILVLLFCLPFKFKYAKNLLRIITDKQNDYSFHYGAETLFVLKLTLIKIPSLLCQLILLITMYKFRKIRYLIEHQPKNIDHAQEDKQLFSKIKLKVNKENANNEKETKNVKAIKHYNLSQQRQYIVFSCFAIFVTELPLIPLILASSIMKPWNIFWLTHVLNQKYDIRSTLVTEYFLKNIIDIFNFIPAILSILILGFYDPSKQKKIFTQITFIRSQIKSNIQKADETKFEFFTSKYAIMAQIRRKNFQQIWKDLLFLPLFIGARVSLFSLMGCPHPADSVQLFQQILMLFYIHRAKRTKFYNQYLQLYKKDEAAGMIRNRRQKLRFWKFAYKSIRHRLFCRILSILLPKKRALKAIANAKKYQKFSAISNHYWNQYQISLALLQKLIIFLIQCMLTFIGVALLLPLTLWRMPTFIVIMRTHNYNRYIFYKVLFKMYKMMIIDIITLPVKLIALVLFPRATLTFMLKNSFKYTKKGIYQFEKIQQVKFIFILRQVLFKGLQLYLLLYKIIIVKLLWVRKKAMNEQLRYNNIKLSNYTINFLKTPQYIPSVQELTEIYSGFDQQIEQNIGESLKTQKQNNSISNKVKKLKDINEQGHFINDIVTKYLVQTKQCLPYLLLMVFLLLTLPWRIFYIKNALFLLRDDKDGKRQFSKLVKTIAKDYKCIFLYFLLFFSIIKTKRALRLFYRNFKLNFYVGTLRYSHLKQLKQQLFQALNFYYGLWMIIFSCIFAPYRVEQIYKSLKEIYKQYRAQRDQEQIIAKIYENTIKEGKSLQLLTSIGHNSLMQIFRFLNARQLTKMTQVSKYMYQSIKQRDQVWMDHWQRLYSNKYQSFEIKNEYGGISYNSMCIEKYKNQNIGLMKDSKHRFINMSISQLRKSLYQTNFDLVAYLQTRIPAPIHSKLFHDLLWTVHQGYGPQQNWPRPDDNLELLEVMGIQRRSVVSLGQFDFYVSWGVQRPVQFFIVRLLRFYNHNTHRRKKQLVYLFSIILFFASILIFIYYNWSWLWVINKFVGLKILSVTYLALFLVAFTQRFRSQIPRCITLNPFDIKQETIQFFVWLKIKIVEKSVSTGTYIKNKFEIYVLRPIRKIYAKINHFVRWLKFKLGYYSDLFIQKVAKPLYISISHKIKALWTFIKNLSTAFIRTLVKILRFIKKTFMNIYNLLFSVVKSISKFYANSLEYSLRLALSYGNVGQLIFTIVGIVLMISPSIVCYYFYSQRWFVILSTIMSMVLMVTGYKHLSRMKNRVLNKID